MMLELETIKKTASPQTGLRFLFDIVLTLGKIFYAVNYYLKEFLIFAIFHTFYFVPLMPKRHYFSTFLGHLSHSGDLLLWVGVRRRSSCVNIFFSRTTGPILTKFGM